jgi:hypothetical protein
MANRAALSIASLLFSWTATCPNAGAARAIEWELLEPGLEIASALAPQRAVDGDSRVHALRIDPAIFDLQILNASAQAGGAARTARQWTGEAGVVAATNAGMFQADYSTSVSLMKSRHHVNNSRLSKHNAVLAFDPRDAGVPRVQIIDRTCQDFPGLRSRYNGLLQSIRMISCKRQNVWREQEKRWSTALVATDRSGRILLIHVRSPYSTHDLIDNLLAMPLDLTRAMYLEGGPQAQLYVKAGGREVELVGSRGSLGVGGNVLALPIPNALAVRRRATPRASAFE